MRDVSPNANSCANFSAIFICGISIRRVILFSDTAQERYDVRHDAATEAQGGSNFNSSARLICWRDIAWYSGSTTARLCVNFSAILWQLAMQSCDAAQWNMLRRRTNFGAIFIRRYSWVCAATKVTILFGNTAVSAAKPQGRPRFYIVVWWCERAMQRDVRSRDKRDVITIRHFVAFYGVSKRSAF